MEILGFGKAKSLGVQRGVVSNITQTIESIRYAINEAEVDSGLSLSSCVVGMLVSIFGLFNIVTTFLERMLKKSLLKMILINLKKCSQISHVAR